MEIDMLYMAQFLLKKEKAIWSRFCIGILKQPVNMSSLITLSFAALLTVASAQLSGTVGPTTTFLEKKAVAICDVTDYGAVASTSDDLSGPLQDAINACADGGLSKRSSIPG